MVMMHMLSTWILLVPLWSYLVVDVSKSDSPAKDSEIASRLLQNYDGNQPPPQAPTDIKIGLYVISIDFYDKQPTEFGLTMYVRQSWKDSRLDFSRIDSRTEKIRIPENYWNKTWIPDIFIRNAKSARFHDVPTPQRRFKVDKSGEVWYVTTLSAVISCPMNLKRFPHDTQTCPMLFESYSYTMNTLKITTLPSPIDVDSGITLKYFSLVDSFTLDCSQNYTTGAYPCLEMGFKFKRSISYVIIQAYLPSILLVIVSWLVFWIDREARMTVGLASLLVLVALNIWVRFQLANGSYFTSYFTSLDVWMTVCHIFIFATLVEYAVVGFLSQNINPFTRPQKEAESKAVEERGQSTNDGRRKALLVDWFSRFLFPLAFLLFNIIYWSSNA